MSDTEKIVMDIKPSKRIAVIRQTSLPNSSNLTLVMSSLPQIGEVVAMGEVGKLVNFKVGSLVAYRQYGEYEFYINGETLYFVKFEDILGTFIPQKDCCKD